MTSSTRSDIGLLYRRAGFGGSSEQLDAGVGAGFEATAEHLLAGLVEPDRANVPVPHLATFKELREGRGGNTWKQYLNLIGWWLDKMAATTTPLREKLTLLLHGQFPTGFSKVGLPVLMYRQNELFRTLGPGSFWDLTLAVSKDPAMLIWLDTDTDVNSSPNENFARELMERFTMGIGHYTQRDVEESARAFTGWSIALNGEFVVNEWAHDFGNKTFLGYHGDLSGEDIVRIVTHTPASARFVSARMWSWLAYPVTANDPVVSDLAGAYQRDLSMTDLLRAIVMHPNFRSKQSHQALVKQPAEWIAGIMRGLGLRTKSFHKFGGPGYIQWVLTNLGQILFDPPTVGGWGANSYWLSTASSVTRLDFAQNVSQIANLTPLEEASSADRIDLVGAMFGVDTWTNTSFEVLNRVRDDPPQLLMLALTAPEVLAN
ncbi:MAG: DUF1800 family protein [Acidimicrobiales bacterium]